MTTLPRPPKPSGLTRSARAVYVSRPGGTGVGQTVRRTFASAITCALVGCAATGAHVDADARSARCPAGMTLVEISDELPAKGHGRAASVAANPGAEAGQRRARAFCVDRWEASLVETTPHGEHDFSPFATVAGHKVRAVSRGGVVPQAYISRNEADAACRASRKRLCQEDEWVRACEGREPTTFPYGDDRKAGYCNDLGKPPLASLYPDNPHSWEPMNDPRLNQQPGTVAKTGAFAHCKSSYGAFDMVGNVHEWVADPGGTFLGGYYLDTSLNGNGCHYKTVAHDAAYHDYSTGFRCCADAK